MEVSSDAAPEPLSAGRVFDLDLDRPEHERSALGEVPDLREIVLVVRGRPVRGDGAIVPVQFIEDIAGGLGRILPDVPSQVARFRGTATTGGESG